MKNNELIETFKNSITEEALDVVGDIAEAGVDALIENDVIDCIPIVKSIKAMFKFGIAVREWHLLKNTLAFLQELKRGDVDENKFRKYQKRLENKKKFDEEIERVMFLIDKQIDSEKAGYLGKLYAATINNKITYDDFVDYSELVDRLMVSDLNIINSNWGHLDNEGIIIVTENSRAFKRLSNQGLGELIYVNVENETLNINTDRYYFDKYSQSFVNIIFDKDQEIKCNNKSHGGIKEYIKQSLPEVKRLI